MKILSKYQTSHSPLLSLSLTGLFLLAPHSARSEINTQEAERQLQFNALHKIENHCRAVENSEHYKSAWEEIFQRQLKGITPAGRGLIDKTRSNLHGEIESLECQQTRNRRNRQNSLRNLGQESRQNVSGERLLSHLYTQENYNELMRSRFLFSLPPAQASCDVLSQRSFTEDDLNNRVLWHQILIDYGFNCAMQSYKAATLSFPKHANAQNYFQSLAGQNHQDLDLRGLKIYLVPHFGYERGEYKLAVEEAQAQDPNNLLLSLLSQGDDVENLSYYTLESVLESHGADVTIVHRNSNDFIAQQVAAVHRVISQETEDYIVLSRSAGSHITHAWLKSFGNNPPANLKAWLNVGGTPRGSTIPEEVHHDPNIFFGDLLLEMLPVYFQASLVTQAPAPVSPSIMQGLKKFIGHSVSYKRAIELGLSQPITSHDSQNEDNWDFPVVNVDLFIDERSHQNSGEENSDRDFLPSAYSSMMKWGPSEMSSLLADSSIDTPKSIRLMVNEDHYFFSRRSAEEGLDLYRKVFKTIQHLQLLD